MSTCPIYQKRGDQLVPVLVIDEAPSSDPSAAGHLVDSNGIASVVQELREEISELQPDVPTIVESVDSITEEDHDGFYWAFDETGAHRVPESNANFPVGSIVYTAMKAAPHGFLICDGSEVGRTTYPDLFTAIGTTYGAGDGTTTFNLPNLMNKTVWGGGLSAVGGEKAAGLPEINGSVTTTYETNIFQNQKGAIFGVNDRHVPAGLISASETMGNFEASIYFAASRSNPIYGNSDTVQPPALVLLPCIKAFEAVVNGGMVDVGELIKSIDALKDIAGGSSNEITNIVQNLGNYLPLAGGTMTGTIMFHKDGANTTPAISVKNDKVSIADTARDVSYSMLAQSLDKDGKRGGGVEVQYFADGSRYECFTIRSRDDDAYHTAGLREYADGSAAFLLDGKKVSIDGHTHPYLPTAGGTMTGYIHLGKNSLVDKSADDLTLTLLGSTGWNNGAALQLIGKSYTTSPGAFVLRATDGTNIGNLTGKPDGTLTWNSKNVSVVEASGSNYIRYTNGLQVCWGVVRSSTEGRVSTSFPVKFKANTPPAVIASEEVATTTAFPEIVNIDSITNSGFRSYVNDWQNTYKTHASHWVAIGVWK